MKNKTIFILYLVFIIVLVGIAFNRNKNKDEYVYNDKDFSIIASSENEVFSKDLLEYMDKNKLRELINEIKDNQTNLDKDTVAKAAVIASLSAFLHLNDSSVQ